MLFRSGARGAGGVIPPNADLVSLLFEIDLAFCETHLFSSHFSLDFFCFSIFKELMSIITPSLLCTYNSVFQHFNLMSIRCIYFGLIPVTHTQKILLRLFTAQIRLTFYEQLHNFIKCLS